MRMLGLRPCGVAATALAVGLKLTIAGCIAAFNYFAWGWITDKFYVDLATLYETWGIYYPYSGDLDINALDSYDLAVMVFLWLPVLLSACCTFLLRALPKGAVPKAWRHFREKLSSFLDWQLPPRRFLSGWCGGVDLRDASVLAFTLAVNAWYFAEYYKTYDKGFDAAEEAGIAFPEPRSRLMLEKVGLIFGIMLWPNIWLLFLPIPQSSFLQQLTGLGYSQMIRYHRWFGHITMVVLSVHGWCYYLYWALNEEFWVEFSDWGTESAINFLAGSIGYIFALWLWATSINWVRRRFFEWFYRSHIICFLGFTLFSYMHYSWAWTMFLPGLLLYAVDVVLRAGQLSNTTLVTAASVDEDANVATLQLKTSKDMSHCPVHELFLLIPSISRWQWHPISVAGVARDAQGVGSLLTLHIKQYGKWSKELLSQLKMPVPLPVRLSAPEGPGHHDWHRYKSVVMLGGGIGATPLLMMLRDIIERRIASEEKAADLPEHVHFVWVARNAREFCILDHDTLSAATSSAGWLTVELYCTGGLKKIEALESARTLDCQESKGKLDKDSPRSNSVVSADGTPAPPTLSSPLFHTVARAIQPQWHNRWHLAAVYLFVWGGCFFGSYLGGNYLAESYTFFTSAGISPYPNTLYWKAGMVFFFTQTVLSIGVPYALVILPWHMWRYWRASRGKAGDEVLPLEPAGEPTGHGSNCQLVGSYLTVSGEGGLEINEGRPDTHALLLAAEQGRDGATIGVFVGGPEAMNQTVQVEVAGLNGRRSGAFFAFHATAHSL